MLVLTRKAGEKIRIGDDIVLTVLEVVGHRIRVGIDAPRQMPILRGELAMPGRDREFTILNLDLSPSVQQTAGFRE